MELIIFLMIAWTNLIGILSFNWQALVWINFCIILIMFLYDYKLRNPNK